MSARRRLKIYVKSTVEKKVFFGFVFFFYFLFFGICLALGDTGARRRRVERERRKKRRRRRRTELSRTSSQRGDEFVCPRLRLRPGLGNGELGLERHPWKWEEVALGL